MGCYESVASFYDRYREPYPPEFFAEAARRLALERTERLLDAACGPAPLAIGFAPFVASCVGVDPEPAMLAVAGRNASQAGVQLELIASRLEDLPASLGLFQVVTIGRALHWLDRDASLPVLEYLVAPTGHVLICASLAAKAPVNPWAAAFHAVRKRWSEDAEEHRHRVDIDAWFRDSPFRKVEAISVSHCHRISVDTLVGRALSMSTTSPAVLGGGRPAFENEMRLALDPFVEEGTLPEEVRASAQVFRRA
jgi:2-polyprenyl-3-methyl-5-hydroxy-6-metoxy-1,4-benzoquinol methylase